MDHDIRTVEIEFLRPGPPHNQLLSPLTQYLAVCGDAGAGTVSMPFEQASFDRRLADLRYADDEEQDQTRRLETLRTIGSELGEVLGAVPGLLGSLTDPVGGSVLTNLRIVSSASELALMPFELAKMPAAAGRPSDEWLSLRVGSPICVTRRERSVRPTEQLLTPVRPNVLFVVGVGIDPELEACHRDALVAALEPWRYDSGGQRPYQDHEPLVQLGGQHPGRDGPCTVPRIRTELERGATLIHFLAHGAPSDTTEGERVGLLLQGDAPIGAQDVESAVSSLVVTGEQLASVLQSLPAELPRPWGILLASCDSAYQSDLTVPGGSFARALHVAGVPLVLASQFPLTYEGSILLTKMLAHDIFWGGNPLSSMASIRAEMHAELGSSHDWASIVVYDALPTALDRLLDRVRYDRARAALDNLVLRMEDEASSSDVATTTHAESAESVLARLPNDPEYEIDRLSVRAYFNKRLAERYHLSGRSGRCRRHLAAARQYYRAAARCFIASKVSQFGANLHWMQTQAISLDHVLGRTPKPGEWELAWQAAVLDLEGGDSSARLWAHSDLAELALLRQLDGTDEIDGDTAGKVARQHVERLLEAGPVGETNYVAISVKNQLVRYRDWFGGDVHPGRNPEQTERWAAVTEQVTHLLGELLEDEG